MVSSLLTVMTWNIWFDKIDRRQRTETLLNEIQTYDPDIIALQEVVQESLEIIVAKMQPTYYVIGSISPDIGYDTLILSKFPPIQWNRYNLPKSKMGRNLLLTTLQTSTRQITVGTFHLESIFYRRKNSAEELKKSQLKYIYAITPMNSILLGDTNLIQDEDPYPLPSPESPESPNNPPIIDVYNVPLLERGIPPNQEPLLERGIPPNQEPLLERGIPPNQEPLLERGIPPNQPPLLERGAPQVPESNNSDSAAFIVPENWATYCGQTNKHIKDKSLQSRLDRIYVKIKRNSLKVHFYGLLGKITQSSDHYGVFCQIEF